MDCCFLDRLGPVVIMFEVEEGSLATEVAKDYTRTCVGSGVLVCHHMLQGPHIVYTPDRYIVPQLQFQLDDEELRFAKFPTF